jgi:hypothetical protein
MCVGSIRGDVMPERPFSRRFAYAAALEAIEPAVAQLSNPEVVVRLV